MDLDIDDSYEQVTLSSQSKQPKDILTSQVKINSSKSPLMSEKQATQLLGTIQLKTYDNQNLLDLTSETDPTFTPFSSHWQFVQNRIIEITGPTTIQQGYIKSYKLYTIKTKKKENEQFDTIVNRRYSDFQYLYQKLIENYGGCLIPKLPQKSIWTSLNMQTVQYLMLRKQKLQLFLQRLLKHRKLKYSRQLKSFLFDQQHNFSLEKGEYFQSLKIEDKITKITNGFIQNGYNILKQYIPQGYLQTKSSFVFKDKKTKQQQQLQLHKLAVYELSKITEVLQSLVRSTCQEQKLLSQFSDICNLLSKQQNEKTKKTAKLNNNNSKQLSRVYYRNTMQIDLTSFESSTEESHILMKQFEDLFEFVESCKAAIGRRNKIGIQLESMKAGLQQLELHHRNNPRSSKIDVTRSNIQHLTKKYEQFTKQLLEQLENQIKTGKDMLEGFLNQFCGVKSQLYQRPFQVASK